MALPDVLHPSASFSATLRVALADRPGAFAELARAIGEAGGLLGAIDLVRVEDGQKVRDVTVLAGDAAHIERIVEAARSVHGVEVEVKVVVTGVGAAGVATTKILLAAGVRN